MPVNNLPLLNADQQARVAVQKTTLALDVLGRFICNTLEEAVNPDRETQPPFDLTANFDAIVIGSGMYGAYCAAQLYRNGDKVLVLDAGPYLISTHYQNLPDGIGLGTGGILDGRPGPNPDADQTVDQVWGLPWRGNQVFARQAFCIGGKSLFWGGWAPRLTNDVVDAPLPGGVGWPKEAADYLKTFYDRTDLQTGVAELVPQGGGLPPAQQVSTDLFNDPVNNLLTKVLTPRLNALVGPIPTKPGGQPGAADVISTINAIDPAPIAIQADAPLSGLFSFDKFSSLGVLVEAMRDDVGRSGNSDQRRRLFVVPNVSVRTLFTEPSGTGQRVAALDIREGQTGRLLNVPASCKVVLALSAIESTRLALQSFGGIAPLNNLMGRNLMAHVRNNATMRIRREALGVAQSDILQTSAFHIVGTASTGGRYHLQFYAGFQPNTSSAESVLYRLLPDTDLVLQQLANQDEEFVTVTFRGIGEMLGRTKLGEAPGGGDLPISDPSASYIDLSQEIDPLFGQRRAWVNYVQQDEDIRLFDEMDQVGFAVGLALAGNDPTKIEYFDEQEGKFKPNNPYAVGTGRYGKLKSQGGIRDPLGTTYHDSGTLWMGDDPNTSVTDSTGRFHQVQNAYCVDQAVFPRVGSANPVPTGLTLAKRSAEVIVNDELAVDEEKDAAGAVTGLFHRPEPDFTPLFIFNRRPEFNRNALRPRDWDFVGNGAFVRTGLVMETAGGIGVLYYKAKEFTDFTLRLQWRAPTVRNNSGVYVRLPKAELGAPDRLIKTGYEIQIDNTGERPGDQEGFPFPTELFNPFHQTGAIYPVHPTLNFPLPGDLPNPNGKPSIAPIPTRALEEWNDMEILVGGNRIRVVLNGVAVLQGGDYIDARNAYPSGLIALQNHFKGFRVQFRHVRIKEGVPHF